MSLLLMLLLCVQDPAPAEKQPAPKQEKQKAEQEVEVTSTRLEVPLKETPAATTIVPRERIEDEHVQSSVDLLRALPGLYINRAGAGRNGVVSLFTRGSNSNHTLVLIDGFRGTRDGGRFFSYDVLPTDNLERVEAVRGSAGAVYGSDAIGGVVNFITRRGEGPPELRMSVEGGTFTTNREILQLSGGNHDYGYSVTMSNFDQLDGRYPNSDFHDHAFSARFDAQLTEKTSLKVVTRYVDAYSEVATNGPPRFVPLDPNASRTDKFLLIGVEATHWATDWLEATVRLSRLDTNEFDKDPADPSDPFGNTDIQTEFSRSSAELMLNAHLGAWGVATLGAEYDKEQIAEFTSFSAGINADRSRNNKALYAQWTLAFNDALFLTPGVRIEDNGAFGTDVNPRMAGAYFCKQCQFKIRGTVGTGIVEPRLDQNYGANGNRDLHPEQSVSWDVGVDQWPLDNRLRYGVTYFEIRMRDIIQFQNMAVPPFGIFVNGGDGVSRGIETEAEYRFMDHAYAVGSFTFLRTRTTELDQPGGATLIEHEPFIRRPTYSGRAYVGYKVPDTFGAYLDLIFIGDRKDASFVAGRPLRETADKYIRVDLAGWVRIVDNLKAIGRLENLFDSPYEEVLGFPANHANFLVGLEYLLRL